ncbi:hypothetical protein [Rubrimonas sp.]|uniref:hypothetical protein n=1 Tax=Rubrimonas sp. TaxID=2036015 RepID=UPI002FDCC10B
MSIGFKEIDYFRSGRNFRQYISNFDSHAGEEKIFFDASPLYFDSIGVALPNLEECLRGCMIDVVLCLRAPFERAYSEYLHDVSANLRVFGHGSYNFYEPSVYAKYFIPMVSRVRLLQARLGPERVHHFSFAANNAQFEAFLRRSAGLPDGWSLDYDSNLDAGFTSPQIFYNEHEDMLVCLRDGLYELPRRWLLTVNRQYSSLHPDIAPRIGRSMLTAQASITRIFDLSCIPDAGFDRVRADYEEACALLDTAPSLEDRYAVYVSKVSDTLPDSVASRLNRLAGPADALGEIYDQPLRLSAEAILAMLGDPGSVAKQVATVDLAAMGGAAGSQALLDGLAAMEARHGLPPQWMDLLVHDLVRSRRFDDLEALLGRYGGAGGLFQATDIRALRDRVEPPLTAEELRRLSAIGLVV